MGSPCPDPPGHILVSPALSGPAWRGVELGDLQVNPSCSVILCVGLAALIFPWWAFTPPGAGAAARCALALEDPMGCAFLLGPGGAGSSPPAAAICV